MLKIIPTPEVGPAQRCARFFNKEDAEWALARIQAERNTVDPNSNGGVLWCVGATPGACKEGYSVVEVES